MVISDAVFVVPVDDGVFFVVEIMLDVVLVVVTPDVIYFVVDSVPVVTSTITLVVLYSHSLIH